MGIRFMLTRGFAGAWMHFLPPVLAAARFRYLGQETNSGLRCHIVAFAQKPGYATIVGWVSHGGGMVCVLYQGIAWIDEVSLRIVRLRTDLLAPRPDIGLERQTNELYLGETRLPQHASLLWLPSKSSSRRTRASSTSERASLLGLQVVQSGIEAPAGAAR